EQKDHDHNLKPIQFNFLSYLKLKQSKIAAGPAVLAILFWAAYNQYSSLRWQFAKIRRALQAPSVAAEPVRMHGKILRKSPVEAEGIHNDALHVALGEEELHDLLVKAGGMDAPVAVGVAKLRRAQMRIPTAA